MVSLKKMKAVCIIREVDVFNKFIFSLLFNLHFLLFG